MVPVPGDNLDKPPAPRGSGAAGAHLVGIQKVMGSNPICSIQCEKYKGHYNRRNSSYNKAQGSVAKPGSKRLTLNQEIVGSNPTASTRERNEAPMFNEPRRKRKPTFLPNSGA